MLKLLKISSRAINKETTPLHDCRAHCAIQPKFNQTIVFKNHLWKVSFSNHELIWVFTILKMVVFSRQVIPWTAMDCVWERNPDGMPSSQRSNFKREKMQNRSAKRLSCLTSETLIWDTPSLSRKRVLVWIGSDFCLTLICHELEQKRK